MKASTLKLWLGGCSGALICLALAAEEPVIADTAEPVRALADDPEKPELARIDASGLLYVPSDCETFAGSLDALFHFHGVPGVVVREVEDAGISAVVRVTNEGAWSKAYTDAWSHAGAFEGLLDDTRRRVEAFCARDVTMRRVALSSFSAGFAAVKPMLEDENVAERVSAVLLEDSLYASYADSEHQLPSATGLQPFVRFAREATAGEKLLAITHSQVRTRGYASTRETADYLLDQLGLVRKTAKSGRGTETRKESFWLRGLPGNDADAHADHLQSMGSTVLARLARYWIGSN